MSEWTTVRCSAETAAAIRAAAKRAGLSGAALLARDYMAGSAKKAEELPAAGTRTHESVNVGSSPTPAPITAVDPTFGELTGRQPSPMFLADESSTAEDWTYVPDEEVESDGW